MGRITKEKHADGTYKQISYDSGERAVSVRNENNYVNKYYYDSSANLTNISEINNSNTYLIYETLLTIKWAMQ